MYTAVTMAMTAAMPNTPTPVQSTNKQEART